MSQVLSHQYGRHGSTVLNEIFALQQIPHQGQEPRKAQVVFFGLDANYSPEISKYPDFMAKISEYHEDGVGFWKKYGVHHPFLLDSYPLKKNTGGVPYHRKFTWLGLDKAYAEKVTFIEILPFPTTGRTIPSKFWSLFDLDHAKNIDSLILSGESRLVILSKSLFSEYMQEARRKHNVFTWLPTEFCLGEMKRIGKTLIYGAPHFSSTNYKKSVFESLGTEVRKFCENAP
ncbi:hypothetical protein [Parahaliea mediterranea]|uniref:hypothetical protein n=1 Tax=Parahaliea mediterranea TaxID=651086 RepID=UPI001300916D|nr:hypothetical protein [Parahaliea mediterranea]